MHSHVGLDSYPLDTFGTSDGEVFAVVVISC